MNSIRYFALVTLIFALCGCGPIYKTQYSYLPPQSRSGKMCLNNCEMSRTNCIQAADMKKENCEYRAELEYQLCLSRHNNDESKCYRNYCGSSGSKDECEQSYNRCYQNCGGTITSQQVCVAFCK